MLLSILLLPGLIFAFELIFSVEPLCIDEEIICECGISRTTVSISCIDDEYENPCAAYEHCQTCEDDVAHCLTCPNGYSGPFCDRVDNSDSRTYYSDTYHNVHSRSRLVQRDLSCPDLRAPKLGSIKCWYSGYEKECTGQCLPGHSFESGETEIKLYCESGVWLPRSSFPPCISEGYCKLRSTGAGFYNCTTGIHGTYCDVTCHGRGRRPFFGRFYCYPGAVWDPPLPYCVGQIAANEGTERTRKPTCECQNGGSCTSRNRGCICPPGYQGTLCETKEYDTRRRCSHPPEIANGYASNTDGSIITRNQQFHEGSSVVYSCHREYGLEGKSLLTCTAYGEWSDVPPKCTSLSASKIEPTPNEVQYCPDPGQVPNGFRRDLSESQISERSQYNTGSRVIFSCSDGFALIGESMLTCSSEKWSSSLPVCQRIESLTTERTKDVIAYCKDPGVDPNGIKTVSPWVNPRKSPSNTREVEYPQGTELEYSCKEGFDLEGENSLLCLFSGLWSSSVPACRRKPTSVTTTTEDDLVYCKDPGVDPNGIKTVSIWIDPRTTSDSGETEYPHKTKIDYSCKEGYELEGEVAIVCLFSGYWSSPTPKCRAKTSAANRESYCQNPGYVLNGRKTVLPFIDPRTNRKSLQDDEDFPRGVKLVYYCDTGFSITGSKIIECQETGTWSSAAPTCEKPTSRQIQGCGRSAFSLTGKILHGEKTVQGEWPWQLAYVENRRLGMSITCGAALIGHSTAITAAHCILPRRLDKTFLYFGKYYTDFSKDDNEVLSRKASEFIVHPRYNRRNMDNDIALVRFSPEVQYTTKIQPICLPTPETTSENLQRGAKGWVTGWGTTENGTDSDILLMAQLPVVSSGQCRDMYRRENLTIQITNNMYCAGHAEGGTDSCTGDSGGPMVFYDSVTESYVLEGIVSFGVKGPTGSCGQKNRYGVYTKVSNYATWIRQYT